MCIWRAVLGKGSELGICLNSDYSPRICKWLGLEVWRRNDGGMLQNCQID